LCHHADIARPVQDTSSGGSIQVLAKVGGVLDLLAERGELAAAEIANLTGEPRSSVYRILGSLEKLDMVEPGSRRGSFRLGLGLLRLGNDVVERYDEREAALPALHELNQLTGETVFMCVRRQYEAVCIERLPGERVESLALRLGGALPLHAGAAPRTLLAFEPQSVWEEYAANVPLEALTPSTPSNRKELFAALEEIKREGVAVSDEDVTPGIAAVGAPIFDYKGTIRGAVSMSGTKPMIHDDAERSISLVRACAASASRALGQPDPVST
jgi:DNA-binding IclR family transcriptional regulator